MYFKEEKVENYRYGPRPADNWGDPTLALAGTYYATIQPFTADDGLHDNQMMQNVRELLVFKNPDVDIQFGDVLKYRGEMQRVAYVLRFNMGLIPHCEVYISSTPIEVR